MEKGLYRAAERPFFRPAFRCMHIVRKLGLGIAARVPQLLLGKILRRRQVRAADVRVRQIYSHQPRSHQIRAVQVGVPQIRAAQVGEHQVGLAQHSAGQIGEHQVRAAHHGER